MDIFKLVGSIFIDTSEAHNSLSKVDKSANSVGKNIGKVMGTIGGIGTAVIGATATMGTALIGVANESSKTADEIDKMSQKIGLSKESYQEWSYIMGQNGMDINILQTGMKTLSNLMDSANNGTQSAIDTFSKLSVSIYDSNGALKSQEEVMNEAILTLASMDASAERTALGVDLFGKSATEMMPMLNQGADAIEELRDRSHELGLIMSDEAVNSGVQFGDLMDDLKQSLGMLATNLGSSLFPILNKIIEYIIGYVPQIQSMVDSFVPTVTSMLDTILPLLLSVAEQVLPVMFSTLESLFPMLVDTATTILPVAIDLIVQLLPLALQIVQSVLPLAVTLLDSLMPLVSALLPILPPIVDLLVTILTPLTQLLNEILPPIIEAVTLLVSNTVPLLIEALGTVKTFVAEFMDDLTSNLGSFLGGIIETFQGVIDFLVGVFTGDWSKALNGLLGIGKGVINTLIGYVESSINSFISGLDFFMSAVSGFLNKIPGVDIKANWEIPRLKIPKLANGGTLTDDGVVMVGEQGAEYLSLPKGAQVTPLNKVGDIDYNRMTRCFVEALTECAPMLQTVVENNVSSDDIFKMVVNKDRIVKKSTGKGAFA